ncbi:hypothetical protein [Collimonas pratensis]|uniref:hypothetical protein n=1 Tax=Collimonas pratensis TaxID=279113 RepID=UPI000782B562|nr:hypothetical protein [Collimonas pratensis]
MGAILEIMNCVENEIVVLDIAGARARVVCGKPSVEASLIALGFAPEGDQMARPISDVADRQKIVGALIELGALFAGGRDWSPAELVDLYREQGTILTGYRMITWKSPSQYSIIDR